MIRHPYPQPQAYAGRPSSIVRIGPPGLEVTQRHVARITSDGTWLTLHIAIDDEQSIEAHYLLDGARVLACASEAELADALREERQAQSTAMDEVRR